MGCGTSTEPPPPVDPEEVQRVYFATADPELHADYDFGQPEDEFVAPPQPSSSGRGGEVSGSTADAYSAGGPRGTGDVNEEEMEPSELAIALERRRLVALARIKHGINGDVGQFPALAPASTTLASAKQRVGHWFKLNDHLVKQADQRAAESKSVLSSPSSFVDYHPNQPHHTTTDEAGTVALNTSFHSDLPAPPSPGGGGGQSGSARARERCGTSSNGTPLSAANSQGFGTPIGFRSRAGSDISSVGSHFSGHGPSGASGVGIANATRLTSRTLYRHQVRLRQVGVPFAVDVRIEAPSMSSYDDSDGDDDSSGRGDGHHHHHHHHHRRRRHGGDAVDDGDGEDDRAADDDDDDDDAADDAAAR